MLTLHDLTAGAEAQLSYLHPETEDDAHAARAVETEQLIRKHPAPGASYRGALAVFPPETYRSLDHPTRLMRTLREQGALGAVLAGPEVPEAETASTLADAATTAKLPLLTPTRPAPAEQVLAGIRAARHQAAAAHTRRLTGLLQHIDRLYRRGQNPTDLLPHLAEATGASIYLATPGNTAWKRLSSDGCRGALQLARGNSNRSTTQTESGRHVMLAPVGDRAPHQVLAAVRPPEAGPWPAHLRDLITLAATPFALLRHRIQLREGEETRIRSRRQVRTSALQALMVGQLDAALRIAAPDPSLHLTGTEAIMAVVSSAPGEQEELICRCEAGLPHALVVPCPAFPDHILIAAPAADSTGPGPATALRGLLTGQAHNGVGVSTPYPWGRLAHAYAAARQALAAAQPGTVATHSGSADLAAALATVPGATRWARRVVSRADAGDPDSRRVDLARLALTAGIPGAASLTRCDRSNVRRDLVAVMKRLGLNHRRVAHRAVAELAFQLAAADDGTDTTMVGLRDLLLSEAAWTWAQAILAPLETHAAPAGGWLGPKSTPREGDAVGLLSLYLTVGCSITATAEGLGLSERSTRPRLSAAAAALGLPVDDARGSGPHPALWALTIAGHLPRYVLPDPALPTVGDLRLFIPHQLAPAAVS